MDNLIENINVTTIDIKWLAERCSSLQEDLPRLSRQMITLLEKTIADLDSTQFEDGDCAVVEQLFEAFDAGAPEWHSEPVPSALPMIALLPGVGCRIVCALTAQGQWLLEGPDGNSYDTTLPDNGKYAQIPNPQKITINVTARSLFINAIVTRKQVFIQAVIASTLCNLLALATSLYSMQVYDRVIPTQGIQTLITLTVGVFIAVFLELIIKKARSLIMEDAVKEMDHELSHKIFKRLLGIRMDQFPASVGTLSAQVRSYETIRSFSTTFTMFILNDAPFALLFLAVIMFIAGTQVAIVVLVFFLLALAIGFMSRKRIDIHTKSGLSGANRKMGLLVEVVEGAESLKSSGVGWQILSRWDQLSRMVMEDADKVRQCSDTANYLSAMVQQLSYVMLVCVGAYIAATSTDLTTGGIIACSILSGRVLAPVGMIPGLIVQWGHAKAALSDLEKVFLLEQDNHEVSQPLSPEKFQGRYLLKDVHFSYLGRPEAISVDKLVIVPGEKIAIVGPIGSGKSTLLKLMAGLYKPQSGQVLFDGLDMQQISRTHVSDAIGYLPQNIHLFGGTLRSNLLMGNSCVSEEDLLTICQLTGLGSMMASHPKGLDLTISEGGNGVSGGQKQLIGLTRLILSKPDIWLLDEPTASLDEGFEQRVLSILAQKIAPEQTLILVTHKPVLLNLVQRLIVFGPTGIILDGPRDAVLERLRQNSDSAEGSHQNVGAC